MPSRSIFNPASTASLFSGVTPMASMIKSVSITLPLLEQVFPLSEYYLESSEINLHHCFRVPHEQFGPFQSLGVP